jgi:hypothetical protein
MDRPWRDCIEWLEDVKKSEMKKNDISEASGRGRESDYVSNGWNAAVQKLDLPGGAGGGGGGRGGRADMAGHFDMRKEKKNTNLSFRNFLREGFASAKDTRPQQKKASVPVEQSPVEQSS